MEVFCRQFLTGHSSYEHLYGILENYSDMYTQIPKDIFQDRESLENGFKRICYKIISTRGNGRSYILAILGWTIHVNEHYKSMDWYDTELLQTSLIEILNYTSFDPSIFCKKSTCIIL